MDKLKALYESYINGGILSSETTFEQFSTANPELQDTLYKQGVDNKVLSDQTDLNMFKSAWGLKKKENLEENISSGVEEVTGSVQKNGSSDSLKANEIVEEGVISESKLFPKEKTLKAQPQEDDSFGGYIAKNLDVGVSTVSKSIYDLPALIYDAAATFTNPIARALGIEEASSEKLAKTFNLKNIPSEIVGKKIATKQKEIQEYSNKNGGDALSALENGNILGAAKMIAGTTAQSIPLMIPAFLSGGSSVGLGIIGASTASTKANQIKEENPDIGVGSRTINAVATGVLEATLGQLLTGASGAVTRKILVNEGSKKGAKIISDSFKEVLQNSIETSPILPLFGEILEESLVSVGEQLTDMATGVKTDFSMREVINSGISSVGMGGANTVSIYGARAYVSAKEYGQLKQVNKNLSKLSVEVLSSDLSSEEKTLLNQSIDRLKTKAKGIVDNANNKASLLPTDLKNELDNTLLRLDEISLDAFRIKSNKDTPIELKEVLLNELKTQAIELTDKKEKILSQEYNLNEFEKLPENEKASLKDQATEILLKEAKDAGQTEINITDKQISDKATVLLKQSQETNKNKQTFGENPISSIEVSEAFESNNKTKTEQDALQERSTEGVDAQESTTGGETMGQGVSNDQSTNESSARENIETKAQTQEEIDKEEASDFEALINPDSKIESDIDNLPIQKQTVYSDKGVDVNLEVRQETPNLSFTKKGKTQREDKLSNQVLKQSKTAAKAISKIFPNIKIVVYRDIGEYLKVDSDNDSGMYNPNDNTIHINLARADGRTVAHEVFHAVLLNKLKMNNKAAIAVTKKMVQALTRSKTLDKATRTELKKFLNNYDSEVQNEEKLAEIVGMVSDNYTSLDASSKSVIRKWVEKIAAGLGIEIGQSESDVVDLLNAIARKTVSGQEITEGDIKAIDGFKGGKIVENPSELFARKSIGGFEISYTENEQISDYLKDGRITQPQNLEFMRGLSSALSSPDDMMVGQLKYKGKVIFEGQGGLFFVTKFGAVWAAGNVKTAKVLADMINRSVKENGGKKGFLTLAKGTDAKLVSSASGVNSTLAILETMLDSGLITPSSFRAAVSSSVIKAGGKINLRQSAKDLKIDVEKYFSDSTTTTFKDRGFVVNDIITALAKALKSPLNKDLNKSERSLVKQKEKENKVKIINFLGGDISKGLGAGTTPKSQSLVDLIAKIVGEKLVKGLNTGDVYAVVEVDGEVEVVEGDHKSYKGFIKQKNGNPPILHLLKDRVHGREYITRDSGKVYTGPAVATNEFVKYNLSDNIDSDNNLTLRDNANEKSETETPEVRKQKSDAEKLGLLYKMNIKGFMPKTIPLGPLQQSARKLGLRVERALFKEGYQKGQVAGYYFSNGITQNGKPRFYNPRAGIRKQQSMGEIGRSETQAIDIIRLGRDNNIKDDTIVDYLKRNTVFLMKDINPLMKITNFALRNVPKVFGNIQGGMMSGIKVFNKVYEFRKNLLDNNLTTTGKAILKLNAKIDEEKGKMLQGDLFDAKKSEKIEAEIKKIENQISKIQKTAKAKNRKFYKFTQEEIDNATLDFLQSQPEYKAASNKGAYSTLQAQMTSQMMDAFEGGFMRGDAAARIKLARKLIKGRGKSDLQATQRDLRNFIRKSLPSYIFQKPEVVKLIRQITNATPKNIENLKEEVLEYVNEKTNTELTKKIRKILGGKYDDTQSGRKTGYKVSDEVRLRIESIQKIVADINSETDYDTLVAIGQDIENKISDIEKLDSIETSKLTAEIADLTTALNFVNAQLSLDISIEKTVGLQSVIDNLNDLVDQGKSELEEAIRAKHLQYIDNFQRAYYEITGKKIEMYIPNPEFDNLQVESKSNPKLIKNPESKQALLDYTALSKAKKEGVINRAKVKFSELTEGMVAFIIGNNDLLNLMSKIGKMPGELFGGDLQEMVTFKIDESTNDYKARKMATTIIMNAKVEEVYGKKWRSKSQKDSMPASTGIVMSSGVEIEDLSQNQMAYLVNQYKDPSNQDSYVNKYGKDYPRVMKEMEALLNEEVQELMRWQVEEFFPSLYDGYNEAYKKVYRTSMPWNEHYAGRIYREGVEDNSVDVLSNGKGAYKGFASPGSTKSRVNNTKAIKSMDQMAAMMTYVNDMNYFAAFSENLNDIANIFGNQNIKDAIVNNYGKGPMKSIDTMIDTLSKRGVSKEYGMDWINNVTSAFVIGRLAINPTIFIKQLTSAPAYAVRIGFRNWMKYGTMGIPDMKANWKEITDNSIYIQDRYGESILRTLETYAPSKIQSLVPSETKDNIINALMYLVKQGDKGAIVIGGVPNYAFYKDQYRKKNPVATDQEVIDYAVKMFERDTKSSQQSSDIQDKDQFQTGGALYRGLNMFLTSVKQYLRKEMTTTRNLYRKISSGGKEGKGTYWENVKTLAMYHSILPVIFQYISAGLPGVLAPWEDEDEETLLRAAVLGNLNGLFIIGSFVEAFGDLLTAKPWTGQDESSIPILTIGLKFFRELNEANQYNVTPFDKNGKQRTEESINESIAGKQNATKKAFFNLANAGLPLKQVERLIKNADLITSGKAQGAELIMRILQFSDYQITSKEQKDAARKKKTKPRQKNLTNKELEKYNPEAYERKMQIQDEFRNSDMYRQQQEMKRQQKERREQMLDEMYN